MFSVEKTIDRQIQQKSKLIFKTTFEANEYSYFTVQPDTFYAYI